MHFSPGIFFPVMCHQGNVHRSPPIKVSCLRFQFRSPSQFFIQLVYYTGILSKMQSFFLAVSAFSAAAQSSKTKTPTQITASSKTKTPPVQRAFLAHLTRIAKQSPTWLRVYSKAFLREPQVLFHACRYTVLCNRHTPMN